MRRSVLEILMDILQIVDHGTHRPTPIMFRANLTWRRNVNMLRFMEQMGLVKVEYVTQKKHHKKIVYVRITPKGKSTLDNLQLVQNEIRGSLQLQRAALPNFSG